ncbi:Acid-sensing ion channel 2 [Galemys pyrenaicus]|uniref:Acid-sensing ion channel 2 n=1 Tax=Galemys pyrenaicus TaxID=202257 RepID=A0A8J6AY35_GALPY|nr:Acid-sensing ion channel 2 [Galemys pyrenaicus]
MRGVSSEGDMVKGGIAKERQVDRRVRVVAELHRVPMDLKESPSEGSLQPSSIQIFANTSTLHGIRHIFVYGPLTIRRVLWAMAFVGSLGLLLVESSERVSYYFSYQHVTKVDEVVAHSLVFPAVTLCNLNGFRFSRLTTNDLYHAGELLALLDVNLQIPDPHLADPTVLEALRQKANFKHYKPKQFSMLEFLHRVGHDLKDMMLYCKFKGQECGHQDFTTGANGRDRRGAIQTAFTAAEDAIPDSVYLHRNGGIPLGDWPPLL